VHRKADHSQYTLLRGAEQKPCVAICSVVQLFTIN